jgi:hypothetical protein
MNTYFTLLEVHNQEHCDEAGGDLLSMLILSLYTAHAQGRERPIQGEIEREKESPAQHIIAIINKEPTLCQRRFPFQHSAIADHTSVAQRKKTSRVHCIRERKIPLFRNETITRKKSSRR